MLRVDNVFPFLSLFGARQRTFRQEEFSKRWVTTCQTVLNDVAVICPLASTSPACDCADLECQRGTLAFVSASFEKWKASQERWRQQTRS